jgi:hypothetical protein
MIHSGYFFANLIFETCFLNYHGYMIIYMPNENLYSQLKLKYMSESTANENLNKAADQGKSDTEKVIDAAGKTWEESKVKVEEAVEKLGDNAGKVWDSVEDKAEVLWEKAQSGELTEEAKTKLGELAEGAKGLWNKLVDKIDGDDAPAAIQKRKHNFCNNRW